MSNEITRSFEAAQSYFTKLGFNHEGGIIFRYVTHDRVFDYLMCGWQIAQTEMGHHAYYSILLNWPCNCKMVEPL